MPFGTDSTFELALYRSRLSEMSEMSEKGDMISPSISVSKPDQPFDLQVFSSSASIQHEIKSTERPCLPEGCEKAVD